MSRRSDYSEETLVQCSCGNLTAFLAQISKKCEPVLEEICVRVRLKTLAPFKIFLPVGALLKIENFQHPRFQSRCQTATFSTIISHVCLLFILLVDFQAIQSVNLTLLNRTRTSDVKAFQEQPVCFYCFKLKLNQSGNLRQVISVI